MLAGISALDLARNWHVMLTVSWFFYKNPTLLLLSVDDETLTPTKWLGSGHAGVQPPGR